MLYVKKVGNINQKQLLFIIREISILIKYTEHLQLVLTSILSVKTPIMEKISNTANRILKFILIYTTA